MKRVLLFALLAVLVLSIFTGCTDSSREYKDDICIILEDQDAVIIIREWTFLLGSGIEIYYEKDDKTTLLGQTLSGDDSYCPFEDGRWSYSISGNTLVLQWAFHAGDDRGQWR